MRRVKVKKLKLPSGVTDKGLADMFNQVIAGDGANPTISYPRYKRLRANCESICKICSLVAGAPESIGWPADHPARKEIADFCAASVEEIATLFSLDLSAFEWDLSLLDQELRNKFAASYRAARESRVITDSVTSCDALIIHKAHIGDMTALNGKFIHTMSGVEWSPLSFAPSLNMKHIFVTQGILENTERMFLMFLHKIYTFGRAIYNELQSPDIDVDKFVDFITYNIDILRKRDGLSRCNDAFDKIKESTKLLKTNFSAYYRQFVDTGDSTIIMQSFITDVSTSTKVRPEVLRQFKTIIGYCTKVAASQSTDPQLKAACAKLSQTMSVIDRKYRNLSTDAAPAQSEEENSEDETDEESDNNSAEMAARHASMEKSVDELAAEFDE